MPNLFRVARGSRLGKFIERAFAHQKKPEQIEIIFMDAPVVEPPLGGLDVNTSKIVRAHEVRINTKGAMDVSRVPQATQNAPDVKQTVPLTDTTCMLLTGVLNHRTTIPNIVCTYSFFNRHLKDF